MTERAGVRLCVIWGIHGLGLLFELLKAPRQIVKINVVGVCGVSADGGGWECVRNRRELWESVGVKPLRCRARACRTAEVYIYKYIIP